MNTNYAVPAVSSYGKYLFCYFTGNEPEQERICFAVSEDGYNFRPLNNNKPIIVQTLGTKCMRDPFILRDREGFYIIATDMKSSDGWCSNHGMISWRSDDLLRWTDETAIDFRKYKSTATADRIWAPEAIFDSERNAYMVYFSVHNAGSEKPLSIWYSHTKNFADFTEPAELFAPASRKDALDADITCRDGKYHMYYKDAAKNTIAHTVADDILGEYREYDGNGIACTERNVEGNCMYNIIGTDTYVMIMDMYSDRRYFMQQTDDMLHFKPVADKDFNLDFSARHGSMLHITDEEYNRLIDYYGC